MAFIDYYKILGVDKNIPQKDVRKAYLKRAKQFHPDLHPDDPKAKAKFQALNEAYEVINDPEKRRKYDQYGEKWKEAEAFNGTGGGGQQFYSSGGSPFDGFDFETFGNGGGFSSFFKDLFGGGFSSHFSSGFSSQQARPVCSSRSGMRWLATCIFSLLYDSYWYHITSYANILINFYDISTGLHKIIQFPGTICRTQEGATPTT